MDQQSIVSLVGQLGAVGALALIVWRSFQAHATRVEGFMKDQLTELVALRTEVRTLVEVLSDGARRFPRLRTAPQGYPAIRVSRDTNIDGDDGGDR